MRPTALQHLMLDGRRADSGAIEVFTLEGDEIVDGVLWLDEAWYRIEDGILDALPNGLCQAARRDRFAAQYGLRPRRSAADSAVVGAVDKGKQIEFFRTDSRRYDDTVSNRSFYVASDRIAFGDWVAGVDAGGLVCDIGAGSGRLTLPLAERGFSVVSTDISEEMLRLSRNRAKAAGTVAGITYVLADAEQLPLGDALFDAATCYGALHHVPHPSVVVGEAARILKPGGCWLSYDPHRSAVRFLFDWAMRLQTLYAELASANPLISCEDAERWCRDAGLRADVRLHFFLPPHVLNLTTADVAERWLRASDRWFNRLGLGRLAGVLIVAGVKPARIAAA